MNLQLCVGSNQGRSCLAACVGAIIARDLRQHYVGVAVRLVYVEEVYYCVLIGVKEGRRSHRGSLLWSAGQDQCVLVAVFFVEDVDGVFDLCTAALLEEDLNPGVVVVDLICFGQFSSLPAQTDSICIFKCSLRIELESVFMVRSVDEYSNAGSMNSLLTTLASETAHRASQV